MSKYCVRKKINDNGITIQYINIYITIYYHIYSLTNNIGIL